MVVGVRPTPRPPLLPGKTPIPIVQEAGWASGSVWTGGKSRPHRDSIPDRPAPSQSLYRLSYVIGFNLGKKYTRQMAYFTETFRWSVLFTCI